MPTIITESISIDFKNSRDFIMRKFMAPNSKWHTHYVYILTTTVVDLSSRNKNANI